MSFQHRKVWLRVQAGRPLRGPGYAPGGVSPNDNCPMAVRLSYDAPLLAAIAERLARAVMQDMRHRVKQQHGLASVEALHAVPSDPAESSPTSSPRPRRIGWANLLARVFALDITRCRKCGGRCPEAVKGGPLHLAADHPEPAARWRASRACPPWRRCRLARSARSGHRSASRARRAPDGSRARLPDRSE
jgi:hypothetical protein